MQKQGRNVTLFWNHTEVLAYIAIADQVRPSAFEAIKRLQKIGIKVAILSGDN